MSAQRKTIRESFFDTVFSLLGHIANCDGYVNRNEIKRIETYMEKMSLSDHCKHEAKHLFRAGTSPQFNVSQVLKEFSKNTTPNLTQILLVYLISMARTDGLLVKKELHLVQKVARELGYNSIVFDHLLRMISAQDEFNSPSSSSSSSNKNNSYNPQPTPKNKAAEDAYEALGVKSTMTDDEIKRAYQKLASQFHPDKLVGQGMPPDLVNAATERFKKIQAAYEFIKKYRSIYTTV